MTDPSPTRPTPGALVVDYVGELYEVEPDTTFTIGRTADLEVDDNPWLHRTMLEVEHADGVWWVGNVGARLAVHVADEQGLSRTTLAPGARLALSSPRTLVTFQAGPTSYELDLLLPGVTPREDRRPPATGPGAPTLGPPQFTDSQVLAILALAEPVLRRDGTGVGHLPTLAQAAERLGWGQTRFNRKLDNVCAKLEAAGVEGLRGGVGNLATNRRAALVHYAVTSLLVTPDDLPKLDAEHRANKA